MTTGALDEAIGAVADLDVDTLTDDELHQTVIELQRCRARLAVTAATVLARWDRRQVWAGDGSRSPAARLARETNCAPSTAAVEVRRARKLVSMPLVAAAVTGGRLSIDHIDLFSRAVTDRRHDTFTLHEAGLVEQCATVCFPDARRIIAYWCQRVDAEQDTDIAPDDPTESAHLHASTTIDGTVVIDVMLDAIGGAAFVSELDRIDRELSLADQRVGRVRTAAQRRAAALVEMARRAASAPHGGPAPRPLFTVHLGDDSFRHLCELANGHIIAPTSLQPWFDEADYETILFDGPSTVISTSHRRPFTGALRRAIEARDRHCQHPSGCDEPAANCDIDHITPWADGGTTSQFNGRLECLTHNRNRHRHDHGATPRPERHLTALDRLRATIRWRNHHYHPEDEHNCDDP